MKPALPLRIATGLALFYAAGHSSGAPWMAPDGPENSALVDHMKGHRFDLMGASRTVWDFHVGFGWIISVDLVLFAVTFWLLANLSKRVDPVHLRPLFAALGIGITVHAVLVGRHFFALPLVTGILIVLCLATAFALASRQEAPVALASPEA